MCMPEEEQLAMPALSSLVLGPASVPGWVQEAGET